MNAKILKSTAVRLLMISLVLVCSCKKVLDISPESSFDENYVFSTVANARSVVYGAYNRLTDGQAYASRLSLIYPYDTDEAQANAGATGDDNVKDLNRYNYKPTNAQLSGPFQALYAGVERSN